MPKVVLFIGIYKIRAFRDLSFINLKFFDYLRNFIKIKMLKKNVNRDKDFLNKLKVKVIKKTYKLKKNYIDFKICI